MRTDSPPRKRNLRSFLESDRLNRLLLPTDDRLPRIASSIESAMKAGKTREVLRVSEEFLAVASDFYRVRRCAVRVLAARPLRVRGCSTIELFGDYHPDTILIRVWMRTAVRKEVTSFGTFLSTLCHEFCHHLDFQRFPDPGTLVDSTNGRLRSITMQRARPQKDWSGSHCAESDGASTGHARMGQGSKRQTVDPLTRFHDSTSWHSRKK